MQNETPNSTPNSKSVKRVSSFFFFCTQIQSFGGSSSMLCEARVPLRDLFEEGRGGDDARTQKSDYPWIVPSKSTTTPVSPVSPPNTSNIKALPKIK
jgi:hypothetical protein